MQNMMKNLADVKEQIELKIRHPYLLKHIESPFVDEDKLLLLLSLIKAGTLPKDKASNYATTTMLIQIALDTHELITNEELDSNDLKLRQLTVLAGVYYSGLYYKILAEIDDIEMIRLLAEGIKEVNEHKISLYQKAAKDIDTLMDDVKKIESSLFVKINSYSDCANGSDFASDLLFVKRLIAERNLFLEGRNSVVFEALKSVSLRNGNEQLLGDEQLLTICDEYINHSKRSIQKDMLELPLNSELLEQRIHAILGQHQTLANTFVEEG